MLCLDAQGPRSVNARPDVSVHRLALSGPLWSRLDSARRGVSTRLVIGSVGHDGM
jgi:hypothetical protein